MQQEHEQKNTPTPDPAAPAASVPVTPNFHSTQGIDAYIEKAAQTLENTESVKGSTRQIVDAGILGMCFTFFIAFLAMQPRAIDVPLSRTIIFFGIAVPLIGWGYLQSTIKAKPGPGWLLLQALLIGSAVGEGVGEVSAAIGFLFLLLHFSAWAFWTGLIATAGAVLAVPIVSFIGLFIYAFFMSRSEERMKQLAALSGHTSEPATQRQGPGDPAQP